MRRTAMKRSRFRPKAKDPAAKLAWNDLKADLWQRAEGKCEVPWCSSEGHDPHHVQKRSQGGPDTLQNLTLLCRSHHSATDLASGHGRLTITHYTRLWAPLGYGFIFFILGDPMHGNPLDQTNAIGPFPEETP